MKMRVKDIEAKAKERPEGYVASVLSKGKLIDNGKTLEITAQAYADLVKQYDPANVGKPVKGICPSCNSGTTITLIPTAKTKKFPPLSEQIKNAGQAVAKIAGKVLKGQNPVVSEAEQKARVAICQTCPQYKDGRCLKCGCITALKTKIATEHCPIGSW